MPLEVTNAWNLLFLHNLDEEATARALLRHTDLPASEICFESLRVAAELCIYTNENIVVEEVGG